MFEQSNFLLEHGIFLFEALARRAAHCSLGITETGHGLGLAVWEILERLTVTHVVGSLRGHGGVLG